MNIPVFDLNENPRKKNRLELLDQLVGSRMQGIAPSDAGRQTFNNLNIERREPIVNVDAVGRGMEKAGASLKSFQEEKVKTPFDEALNFAFKTLPGNSIELGGQIMQLNQDQAVELAKTIGLQGAELANRVAQATKSPQGTGQLVKDTMSWIAKNVGTTEQLTELLNSLTVGDVMGGGSLAVTPFIKKGLKKTIKDADATSQLTQRGNTFPTYENADAVLNRKNPTGETLDYGAGLGKSQSLGYKTFEPFPKEGFEPDFLDPSEIASGSFSRITNLNVLNVLPKEARDQAVQEIGRILELNGQALISTRKSKNDVLDKHGKVRPGQKQGLEEGSVITGTETFQKGIDQPELESYIKEILGDGFDVERPAKSGINTSHVLITKRESLPVTQIVGRGSVNLSDTPNDILVDPFDVVPSKLNEASKVLQATIREGREDEISNLLGDIKKLNTDISLEYDKKGKPHKTNRGEILKKRNKLIQNYTNEFGWDDDISDEAIKHQDLFKTTAGEGYPIFGGTAIKTTERKYPKWLNPKQKIPHPLAGQRIPKEIETSKRGLDSPAVLIREAGRGNISLSSSHHPNLLVDQPVTNRQVIRPEDLEGKALMSFPGDRGRVAKLIGVGNVKFGRPVEGQGGPWFPDSALAKEQPTGETTWASNEPTMQAKWDQAKRIEEMYDKEVVGAYMAMNQDAVNFSTPVMESVVELMAASGNAIKEETLDGATNAINKWIKTKNKGVKSSNAIPDFVGFTHPDMYQQIMGIGKYSQRGSGALRKSIIEVIGRAEWHELGFPNIRDVHALVNDSRLYNINQGDTGAAFFTIDTSKPLAVPTGKNVHNSYDAMIHGKDLGTTSRYDVPANVVFRDQYTEASQQLTNPKEKDGVKPTRKPFSIPQQTGQIKSQTSQAQLMTPEIVDSWSKWIDMMNEKGVPMGGEMPLALALIAIIVSEGETE